MCLCSLLLVLSKMQSGTANATDLATIESIQAELTAGFAALPADAQAQLQPAITKITEILQQVHDALAAQIGGAVPPPTSPSNATTPVAPVPAPAPAPVEPAPAAPPATPVQPAPAPSLKHSVIKKKRQSHYPMAEGPSESDSLSSGLPLSLPLCACFRLFLLLLSRARSPPRVCVHDFAEPPPPR